MVEFLHIGKEREMEFVGFVFNLMRHVEPEGGGIIGNNMSSLRAHMYEKHAKREGCGNCGRDAVRFRDSESATYYSKYGLCQTCQDGLQRKSS